MTVSVTAASSAASAGAAPREDHGWSPQTCVSASGVTSIGGTGPFLLVRRCRAKRSMAATCSYGSVHIVRSADEGGVALPVALPEEALVELAVVVAREVRDEVDGAGTLVARQLCPAAG